MHHLARECGNSSFCQLQSTDCVFWGWGLFGKELRTIRTSQIFRQCWALLWWTISAACKFCCCNLWILLSCCSLPAIEGPRIWCVSIDPEVFSLRSWAWLEKFAFFCSPEEVPRFQYVTYSATPSPFKMPPMGPNVDKTGWKRYLFQDEDHFENGYHLFPRFLQFDSGMSPEKLRTAPELIGSNESRLNETDLPEFDHLCYWTLETFYNSFSLFFPLTPG